MPTNILIIDIVSVAVAFVPEGLPIALTASLTIIANIMRKNNIPCKSLKTVETLGSISVLLSDKTGTLTKNQMSVSNVCIGNTETVASEHVGGQQQQYSAISQLRAVAAICNAGEFEATTLNRPLKERTIHGDATDQAVLRFSESLGPTNDMICDTCGERNSTSLSIARTSS